MIIFFSLIFVGIFLWLANLGFINLARDWPVILIVVGLINLCYLFKRGRKKAIIDALEKGNISVEEAEKRLKKS